MMEYGELNDDDIHDMVNATQVEETESNLNDSWSQKFPNTDHYVLYGTQKSLSPEKEIADTSEKKEIVITVDSQIEKLEQDIFADVFEEKAKEAATIIAEEEEDQVPDVEVASIASSDGTVEYEIPEEFTQSEDKFKDSESGFVSEEGKDTAVVEKEEAEKAHLPCSENEKFWNILENDDDIVTVKESPAITEQSQVQEMSENEKFWAIHDDVQITIPEPQQKREQTPEKLSETMKESTVTVEQPQVQEVSENEKFWVVHDDVQITIPEPQQKKELTPEKPLPQPIIVVESPTKKELSKEEELEVESVMKALEEEMSKEEIEQLQVDVKKQTKDFEVERNKLNRMGMSITQSMTNDCKELLKLFGIPYIKSPTEAEAQCAFLNDIDMIDGIITDDSDVWLFGAKTVYKNFFVQKKNVMEFRMENVRDMFHLDRQKLIQLAMLVGSDYTLGLSGVGAVTAMEILAAFPSTPEADGETDQYQSLLSSLRKFREWLRNGRDAGPGKTVLKNKLKNVEIIEGFPSIDVVKAYLEPIIDTSTEQFSWGSPDSESLVEYAKNKLGWTRMKTEEILKPVLKRLNEKKQATIKDYFKSQMNKKVFDQQKMSKRVQKAVGKIGGVADESDEKKSNEKKPPRKRKVTSKKKKEEEEKEIKEIQEFVMLLSDDDDDDMMPPVPKKSSPEKPNAFSLLKQPEAKLPSPKKAGASFARKRRVKKDDPQPSTSSAADDVLPPKRVVRIPETKQVIPQRERDKEEQERIKQQAIEIFKKSKTDKSSKRK